MSNSLKDLFADWSILEGTHFIGVQGTHDKCAYDGEGWVLECGGGPVARYLILWSEEDLDTPEHVYMAFCEDCALRLPEVLTHNERLVPITREEFDEAVLLNIVREVMER